MLVVLLSLREAVMSFPLVRVKILDMIEKKKLNVEIAKLYGKNESSIREVMKNKETSHASFFVAPQLQNLLL